MVVDVFGVRVVVVVDVLEYVFWKYSCFGLDKVVVFVLV